MTGPGGGGGAGTGGRGAGPGGGGAGPGGRGAGPGGRGAGPGGGGAGPGGRGAGPGGKILSRRYHLSSGRTPYTKSRQQGRQGFIGRVTDSLKSIVPGWLEKYFNKSETTNNTVQRKIETKEHTVDDVAHIDVDDGDKGSPTTDETSEPTIGSSEDVAVSINKNAPQLWSTEVDRSQTSSDNISKKTMSNLSAFGALSPCSQLGDSPFYPGKTSYGGAAAARLSRMRVTPYQPSLRQVKAKPAKVQSHGVTSCAASHILEALKKMSSPIAEAKKIPMLSPPHLPLPVAEASNRDLQSWSSTLANSSSVFGGSAPSSNPANSTSVFGSAAPRSTAPPSSNVVFGIAAPARKSANSSNVLENTAPTNTSANVSGIFGNSAVAANPPAATFLFGQPSSTTSGSVVGNLYESKSTFAFSGQESKPDTSSSNTSTNATSIYLGVKPASANPAAPSFNFGATNTSNVAGSGTSPFYLEQIHKALLSLALQLVQIHCQHLGRAQVRLQSQLSALHRCFPLVLNPSQFLALYLQVSSPLHLGSKPPSLPLDPLLLLLLEKRSTQDSDFKEDGCQ